MVLLFAAGCVSSQKPAWKPPEGKLIPQEVKALMESSAFECRPLSVEALLKAGVPVNSRDSLGRTALMLAVGSYDSWCPDKVVHLLLEAGADPNLQDKNGDTALHWLVRLPRCSAADMKTLNLLLGYDANPAIRNKKGQAAFDVASDATCQDKMEMMVFYLKEQEKQKKQAKEGAAKPEADKAKPGK